MLGGGQSLLQTMGVEKPGSHLSKYGKMDHLFFSKRGLPNSNAEYNRKVSDSLFFGHRKMNAKYIHPV